MKKSLMAFLAIAALLSSCSSSDKKAEAENEAMQNATKEELLAAIAERDQLLELVNEITATTSQIRDMEQIVSINAANGENAQGAQVNSDLEAIKATLKDRRERLESLEAKLKKSNSTNANLLATIDALKTEIANQSAEIASLTRNLEEANQHIAKLDDKVDSLNNQVSEVTEQRDQAQKEVAEQIVKANECYYVVATTKELKEHNIIEGGGFLRKQKILDGEFDKTFFVTGDKRTLTTIPLYSKKAKVLTPYQPKDSYEIVDVDGQKVLRILNPNAFWSVSNFLVIKVD